MKFEAWLWGFGLAAFIAMSVIGMLPMIPGILVVVPAGLYALGAGSFCLGRPGLRTRARTISCMLAAATALIAAFNIPLKAGFLFSREALNESAARAPDGECPGCPARVGLYHVIATERDEAGTVILWVRGWKNKRAGFMKTRDTQTARPWKEIRLTDEWRFVVKS